MQKLIARIESICSHRAFIVAFSLLFLVFNLIQSIYTGLLHDEAYYWFISQKPEWGYYHGPPLIALLTGAGYALVPSELGIRLASCLSSAATVYILYQLIKPKNNFLFLAVVLSVSPFMIAGFIAALDPPLLFFTACFLLVYRNFLEKETWSNTILLGVLMAAMIYMKYHGILPILFTLLSNPRLLLRFKYYVAGALGCALYLPHLVWQYHNDFAPILFHFVDRSPEPYNIIHSLNYIGSQLLMAGVPAGLLLLYAAFRNKSVNLFDRGLKFVLWGIYLFFFISSLKGHTEANWTAIAFLPLTILSYQWLENSIPYRKWLYYLLPVSIAGVAVARLFMATDFIADRLHAKTELHHWRAWAETVKEEAQGRPVVFMNSYQKACKYHFYTGQPALSVNNVMSHKDHFNLSDDEMNLLNQSVYFYSHYGITPTHTTSTEAVHTMVDDYTGCMVDSFQSWMKVMITPLKRNYKTTTAQEYVEVAYTVSIPEVYRGRDASKAFISYQLIDEQRLPYDDSITTLSLQEALRHTQTLYR
ncbi:MAG: glycosyltransferase family 39 protein [Bacteroidetes bacterium]|nr:glycosyltransferase family 39 protein [Bacteroidota bacterium]